MEVYATDARVGEVWPTKPLIRIQRPYSELTLQKITKFNTAE